jgi:hypothetical protein
MKIVSFTVTLNEDIDTPHAIEKARETVSQCVIVRGKLITKETNLKIECKEPYTPKPTSTWKSKKGKK